ncbi:DNA primase [Paraburkholderia fungorum]|uniref:LPD7 domain-containing protein n=1 Tax=Paraburkholderia fungorum TaxID=134537 RepID=UPI0004879D48|nr:LPD7 domain-containing protein [Paraburkholderia fungorum]MDE1005329.1 DNA primase [Paraburkholderia fungorum]PNE56861.1 DNA primase [Paraburkholderia fungorum]
MMDETATSSGPHADEPVINVIEPDPPPIPDPQGGAAGARRFDQTEADALAARRRREFDAARARLRDQAIQADAPSQATVRQPASQAASRGTDDASATRWAPLGSPPETVRKRYLRAGNQYFLKDAPHQLAFEDIGRYLVTEHNRPDVVESMVDMARAKAWGRIRVSGHEQFRREVWVQATLLGIEVSGYEPKAVDFARLAEGRRDRMTNRIDVMETTAAAQDPANRPEAPEVAPGPTESQAAQPARRDAPRQPEARALAPPAPAEPPRTAPASETGPRVAESEGQERQRYMGELVEHGGAPYQHNPARSDSYYVVYRDTGGADHVVWGVDLERAVADSGVLAGQQVMLENLGRRLVTVKVPVLDATGNVIGEEESEVYRNTWQVDVVGQERTPSRPRATERQGEAGRSEAAMPATPEEAQTARRREPSIASPGERVVQMAVLTAAMRQQGFSERSIARVQQRAQRLLSALESEGVTVPRPHVFDPEAPSTRSRRTRTATERVPSREVERGPTEPAPPSL